MRCEGFDDAVKKANGTEYGLQAAVFTSDINTAHAAVRRLQVGGVMVNDSSDYRLDAMPFGSVRNSGLGREGVRSALLAMTEPKVACFNLTPVKERF